MIAAVNGVGRVNGLDGDKKGRRLYKVVLTGGPCAGKTTVQAMMSTFFEILVGSGGVKFADLDDQEVYTFQENLIRTLLQLEQTFFDLAATCQRNTLVISDRGAMDPSTYMSTAQWEELLNNNKWNNVSLRDARYDQVIHLVSAAQGAEDFYTTANNQARKEPIQLARELDRKTQQAWVGHPYVDVIDNCTNFNNKVRRAIDAVCNKIGIYTGDRLSPESIKRKFLISALPDVKILCSQLDHTRHSVYKTRRCFLWKNQYYQLDIYNEPCHPRCKGLLILETYTTKFGDDMERPDFLDIAKEVTGDPFYSMFHLSLKK
ncbi:hypothetical protein OS493_030094 [Desmophyllum pertusum]|uniref:NadR/Ttd14 AAA domain-containing protein n=2 Tax=Desmophyllum pertusum TaxID=174260 RepID=A0A9W9Z8T3_9CNID|nr:hypothetical protein OS493_030094 [Desmophyllum pertusum]